MIEIINIPQVKKDDNMMKLNTVAVVALIRQYLKERGMCDKIYQYKLSYQK